MIEQNKSAGNDAIPYLIGLRGLAIFLAVSFHCLQHFAHAQYDNYIVGMAFFAMSLFFSLSGFVLTIRYCHLFQKPKINIYNFYVARIARLVPLYGVFLLFAVGFMSMENFSNFSERWPRVLSYFTLTQSWVNNQSISSVGTISWSISNEIFSYTLFPAAIFLLSYAATLRKLFFTYIIVIFLGLGVSYLFYAYGKIFIDCFPLFRSDNLTTDWIWICYYNPYLRFFDFLMGCVAAKIFLYKGSIFNSKLPKEYAEGILFLCLLAIIILLVHRYDFNDQTDKNYIAFLGSNFGLAPFIGVILIVMGRSDGIFKRFFVTRPFLVLGDISYSMYLLHLVCFRLIPTPISLAYTPPQSILLIIVFYLSAMIFTGIVSYMSWKFIEVPSRRWMRSKFTLRE